MEEMERMLDQVAYFYAQGQAALARGDFDMASYWGSRYDEMLSSGFPLASI